MQSSTSLTDTDHMVSSLYSLLTSVDVNFRELYFSPERYTRKAEKKLFWGKIFFYWMKHFIFLWVKLKMLMNVNDKFSLNINQRIFYYWTKPKMYNLCLVSSYKTNCYVSFHKQIKLIIFKMNSHISYSTFLIRMEL